MTEPQQEYIITEKLLSSFERLAGKLPFPFGQLELNYIQEQVRSRPIEHDCSHAVTACHVLYPARPIALSDLLRIQGIGPAPTLAPKEKHVAEAAPSSEPTDATGFWLTPKEMKQHDAAIRNQALDDAISAIAKEHELNMVLAIEVIQSLRVDVEQED